MSYNKGYSNAREEQLRRRADYERNIRYLQSQQNRQRQSKPEPIIKWEYSEFSMRRMAPFAFLIYATFLILLISWIISGTSSNLTNVKVDMQKPSLTQVNIPADNGLYNISVKQNFPIYSAPLYSELEIEILDENYGHVYSFYKDLWQERYSNGDGNSVYRDLTMNCELEIDKAGTYYIRAISHDENKNTLSISVGKRLIGGIYFKTFVIIFGVLIIILLLGSGKWGGPVAMFHSLKKLRSIRNNKALLAAAGGCILLIGLLWFNAISHKGYAKAADENVLPTRSYSTNKVIYLG